jgi:hypothetical protein
MKSIYSVLVLSIAIVASAYGYDKSKETFTKSVKKEYDISRSGKVVLSNKYGNIDVKTNDGDKVTIDVEITVNARNEETANTAFERINIDFSASSDYVKAETILDSDKGNWWAGNKKSYDFKINYEVTIPRSVELDVSNKYGDVYITELENDLELNVKYGNFNVVSAEDFDLTCKYGSGEIENCKDITADLGYVSGEGFKVGICENVELDTKYSKIRIKSAKDITADAGYDNYGIGTADAFKLDGNYNKINITDVVDFSADTRYTNINIEELRGSVNLEMGYGGLEIYKVHKEFREIDVDCKYASVKIGTASDASYNFDLDADYAGIEVPDNSDIRIRDNDSNSKHVEGQVGSNPSGRIKVNSSYGSIKIR